MSKVVDSVFAIYDSGTHVPPEPLDSVTHDTIPVTHGGEFVTHKE
ncbi:hypothetical protein [Xanthomonas phage SB4]|uniref:Uncharacterized protein n=1 Tax=Xanthomonas phage SB4 TaxID=3117473 RepID=A0ABZ2GUQ6_9CAUD